jgi:hypothetical protein
MTTFIVIGAIVLLVGAYLALDWYLAGRSTRRSLVSAKNGGDSAQVGRGLIERQNTQNNFNTSI